MALLSFCTPCFALTCNDLDLVCPGRQPTEIPFTYNENNIPSKDGTAYVWESTGRLLSDVTSNITCEERNNHLVIYSTGVPAGKIGKFPFTRDTTDRNGRGDNPNRMSAQSYVWKIPKAPRIKSSVPPRLTPTNAQLPMGPIGFALNGVPFFNPYNAQVGPSK